MKILLLYSRAINQFLVIKLQPIYNKRKQYNLPTMLNNGWIWAWASIQITSISCWHLIKILGNFANCSIQKWMNVSVYLNSNAHPFNFSLRYLITAKKWLKPFDRSEQSMKHKKMTDLTAVSIAENMPKCCWMCVLDFSFWFYSIAIHILYEAWR